MGETKYDTMNKDLWNKCHECGRIIPYVDFADGRAVHRMLEPDSDLGVEKWETLCRDHYSPRGVREKEDG